MLKRLLLSIFLSFALIWAAAAMAENIGIVDMRAIFQSSPQIKQVNDKLNKQFAPERDKIVQMGKSLQDDVKKFQRNQSVMDKAGLDKLRNSIAEQEQNLRTMQAKFQQELFTAQNQAMGTFMDKLTSVVKKIAEKKNLDVVLPKNTVLYAKDGMDITSDVLSSIKQ